MFQAAVAVSWWFKVMSPVQCRVRASLLSTKGSSPGHHHNDEPDDDGEEKTQATTKRVKNNGFNPVWNEAFNFDIKLPQLAFLTLKIKEHTGKARSIMDLTKMSMKSKDKDLGIFCSPLQLIQEGYRRVPLKNKSGKDLAPATLLIHIAINKSRKRDSSIH